MTTIRLRALVSCLGGGMGLAVMAMLAGCGSESTKPAVEATPRKHIPLPITYAIADVPGVMLFANEADGMVALGNRDPGNWRFGGPPSPDRLEACKAGPFRCVRGVSGVQPIVVGDDMPVGVPHPFPGLNLIVERFSEHEAGCDKFVSRPLPQDSGAWSQTVVHCGGIGVVQIQVFERGTRKMRLDLKSAEGLLATGLVFSERPADLRR